MRRVLALVEISALAMTVACGRSSAPASHGYSPTTPAVSASATPVVPSPIAGSQQTITLPDATSTPAVLRADVSFPAPQDANGNQVGILAGSPNDSSVVLAFIDDHSSPAAFQETLKLFNLNSRATTSLFTLPRSFTAASVAINSQFMAWSEVHVQVEQPGSMLMLWDRTSDMQPVELARDPNAGGPPALAFLLDGSQAVYRMSAGGTQLSDSLLWEDLTTRQSRTIYTAPPHAMVMPRALGDDYVVWTETTRGVAADGSPKITSERVLYTQLNDSTSTQPHQIAIPDTNAYYGAILDGDALYFQRDDGVVRIDNWRTEPQMRLIWRRNPDAGSFLVRSGGMLAWTDSTDGRVVVFDTAARSTFIAPSSGTGALVSVKGMLVWETSPQISDPSSQDPATLNWLDVPAP